MAGCIIFFRGVFMGRRIIKNNIFSEIILGLGGKDALAILNDLADIQNSVLKNSKNRDLNALKKIEEMISSYPLKYRLISKGFICGWDLDTINQNLHEKTGSKLYARDLIDATLIYSFKNSLSFESWKELITVLKDIEKNGSYDELLVSGISGSYSSFPLSRIETYVKSSSLLANEKLFTIQRTKTVEQSLDMLSGNKDFVLYISENIRTFCAGREKARYYICKYFLLYLNTKISDYISSGNQRALKRNIYLELPLSNISTMDPKRHAALSEDEIRSCLDNAKISSNKLFELLNRFYSYILLSDSDANDPNWEEYSLMSKILRGESISRNLLMLIILFLGTEAEISDIGLKLSVERMNDILRACSFDILDENLSNDSIDSFILKALRSDDTKGAVKTMLDDIDEIKIT